VLLIVDGHCELENRSLLKNISAAFQRSGADCLGRPQPLEISEATPMQQAIALVRSSRLGHHPQSFIYANRECFAPAQSVAVAYRREVFEKVGYFDERFDACEDVELNHRIDKAGLKCFFTPSIRVRYYPRSSLRGLFHQLVRYGRGRVGLLHKHPESFALSSFLPALFLLGTLFGWIGGLLWSPLWLVYFGALGFYAGAILVESLLISLYQKQLRLLFRLPIIFLTVHLAAGWGVLADLAGIPRK
jgi:succinoglycan biosynthesis protein ExoA